MKQAQLGFFTPKYAGIARAINVNGVPTPKGATYSPALDGERLGEQYVKVRDFMASGAWRTLAEIAAAVGAPEASVSARLRDMRRDGWTVERQRVEGGNGLHQYAARRTA